MLLLVVGGFLLPDVAHAAVPGCDELTVQARQDAASSTTLEVTVPAALGLIDVPSAAFQVTGRGGMQAVLASRRDPRDLAVVAVIAGARDSTLQSVREAVAATRDLLAEVPAGAQVALLAGDASGRARILAPLSSDRSGALSALASFELPGQTDPATAVALAAEQLPEGSRGHVVIITAGTLSSVVAPRGVVLHQVALAGTVADPTGCPAGRAPGGLIPGVDALASRLSGEYVVQAPAVVGEAQLRVDYLGTSFVAELRAPGVTPSAPPPAGSHALPPGRSGTSAPLGADGNGRSLPVLIALAALLAALAGLAAILRSRRSPLAAGAPWGAVESPLARGTAPSGSQEPVPMTSQRLTAPSPDPVDNARPVAADQQAGPDTPEPVPTRPTAASDVVATSVAEPLAQRASIRPVVAAQERKRRTPLAPPDRRDEPIRPTPAIGGEAVLPLTQPDEVVPPMPVGAEQLELPQAQRPGSRLSKTPAQSLDVEGAAADGNPVIVVAEDGRPAAQRPPRARTRRSEPPGPGAPGAPRLEPARMGNVVPSEDEQRPTGRLRPATTRRVPIIQAVPAAPQRPTPDPTAGQPKVDSSTSGTGEGRSSGIAPRSRRRSGPPAALAPRRRWSSAEDRAPDDQA